ncbi:hypothetical protein IMZ48_29755, partial [Candidatus Bathyarchaeota archaeon]|nr:hypothetical protein [Candidatus Bathyarchaeota archaeon]
MRPAFRLGEYSLGSPVAMMNIELPGTTAGSSALQPIASLICETIAKVGDPGILAAHLHNLPYEKSPQRIWQGFLGRRHP